MKNLSKRLQFACGILVLSLLAACSTLNPSTALQLNRIDFLNDDIASMVIAIDVPVALVPLPEKSSFNLIANFNDGRSNSVSAPFVRAADADIFDKLSAPASGRGFFIFQLADSAKAEIREAQKDLKSESSAAGGVGGSITTQFNVQFCRTGPINPEITTFSASIILPNGTAFQPILTNEKITTLLEASGQQEIATCAEAMQ